MLSNSRRKLLIKWVDETKEQDITEPSIHHLLKALAFIMYQYHVNILHHDPQTMRVRKDLIRLAIP